MNIKYLFTKRNYTKGNNKKNEYIVIHYVGAKSSALNNAKYFENIYRGASAHYFVDNNEIYQVVKEKDVAWHCGSNHYKHSKCRNSNSIGIEMCCYINEKGQLDISEKVIDTTVELVKELMAKYNIPIENVIRHYDVTGKNCPAPLVKNANRWIEFIDKVKGEVKGKYQAGQVVEINVPMYFTGAIEGNRYLYDNTVNQAWINEDTRSLIKNDILIARATIAFAQKDKYIVQVFLNQFWINEEHINKVL